MGTIKSSDTHRRLRWARKIRFIFSVLTLVTTFGAGPILGAIRQNGSPQRFRATKGLNANFGLSGQPVHWIFHAHGSISSSPLIVKDNVYIASNGHRVYDLNINNGDIIWKYHALDEVMTQPLYAGSVVIIATGNAKVAAYRPMNEIILGVGINEIVGLSVKDGNAVWSLGLAGTGMPTGIIVNHIFYHIDGSGEIVAVRANSGRYLWRRNVASTAFMTAINYRHELFYTAGTWPNRVIAFNSRGHIVWTHEFSKRFSGFSDGPLALSNGQLYGVYMENTPSETYVSDLQPAIQHVYALSLKSGLLRWDVPIASGIVPPFNMSAIPLAIHNLVIVGSPLSPYLSAINTQNGRLQWRLKVGGPVKNGPVETHGTIYFGDLHGDIFAVNEQTGTPVGCIHFADIFNVGSGAIARHTLIIGSGAGRVYAIPLATIRSSHECTGSVVNLR